LAAMDEYRDRPAEDIADWFQQVGIKNNLTIEIINGLTHNLSEDYALVSRCINKWVDNN